MPFSFYTRVECTSSLCKARQSFNLFVCEIDCHGEADNMTSLLIRTRCAELEGGGGSAECRETKTNQESGESKLEGNAKTAKWRECFKLVLA